MKKKIHFITNSPTLTTWLSFLTKAINLGFILPLVLKKFIPGDISLWYLYIGLLNLLVVFDSGFGSTFSRIIAYGKIGVINLDEVAEGKPENATNEPNVELLVNTNKLQNKFYIVLSVISIVALIFIGFFFMQKPIGASSNPEIGWITWALLVITYPFLLYGNSYVNILIGTNNIPKFRLWETLFNLFAILTNGIAILLFPNVFLLILLNQFWLVIAVLRNKLIANKLFTYSFDNENLLLSEQIRKATVSNALKSGVGVVMSLGIVQFSSFILAQYLNASDLASYLFCLNTIQVIRNFAQAPFYSKLPQFNALMGSGDIKSLRRIAQRSMRMVYAIYSFFFFLLAFTGDYIFQLLNSQITFPNRVLWSLFGLGFLIERYGAMHLQIYSTTNKIIWHKVNGITGLLMIAFGLILFPKIGIIGLPLALILSYMSYYSWYSPMLSYNLLNVKFWKFEKLTVLPYVIFFLLLIGYLKAVTK